MSRGVIDVRQWWKDNIKRDLEKALKSERVYICVAWEDQSASYQDGFSPAEIIGLLELAKQRQLVKGKAIARDILKRQ